jgi:hypothetical protein
VKLRNDDASVLRFTLLAALSKVIEAAGITNRISQLTPAVQCVSQVFRSNKMERGEIEWASVVAYRLLNAEAHGMDVIFAQALDRFSKEEVASVDLVGLVAAFTYNETYAQNAWAASNKRRVLEALCDALKRPDSKKEAIHVVTNMSMHDLEGFTLSATSLRTIFGHELLSHAKGLDPVVEIVNCAYNVCSNRYQNTRALAVANLPKCIMAIVAPLGDFSVGRNADESAELRVRKSISYVRQKGLATLALVATIGPATRASFKNQDIALLRQVAGDADSEVARYANNVLQILQAARDCRLSQAQAKKLPSITALDTGTCSVCIEEWAVKDELAQLSCGHVFHPTCIQSWVVRSASCPECRSNVAPA